MQKKYLSFVVLALLATQACKTSGDIVAGRVYEDPTNVKTVDKTTDKAAATPAQGAAPAPNAPAQAEPESVEDLKRNLAIVQGQLEDTKVHSEREKQSLHLKVQELEAKLVALSEENAKLKTAQPQVNPAAAEAGSKKTGAPLLWELAVKDLNSGKFDTAVSPLNELVSNYPKFGKSLEATLTLALVQYKLRNYKDSAITFNKVIDKFSKSSQVSMAWFGQGASFAQMDQREDAKLFFDEVIKAYPKSKEAKEAKAILKKKSKVPADLFDLYPNWIKSLS